MNAYAEMRHLAERIIIHGIDHWPQNGESEDVVFNRKIGILHIDQGAELILKAYLLQSGYLINTVKQKKVREGLKPGDRIDKYLNKSKTLDFEEARQLCKKLMRASARRQHQTASSIKLDGLAELHKKRNAIQHYGVGVRGKTSDLISSALRDLLAIYQLAGFKAEGFLERVNAFITRIEDSYFQNP